MCLADEWERAFDIAGIPNAQRHAALMTRMDEKFLFSCILCEPRRIIDFVEVECKQQGQLLAPREDFQKKCSWLMMS